MISRVPSRARVRLWSAAAVAVVTGTVVALCGYPLFAVTVGWSVAGAGFIASAWASLRKMDAAATRSHAQAEDPSRGSSHTALILAAVASLVALVVVLAFAADETAPLRVALTGSGLMTVMVSWALIHTLYAVRYADLYYAEPVGGIEFGGTDEPDYRDFAYLAFTVGMTYQVSDTALTRSDIRRTALSHALLSFLFGAFVLAVTINLVAGLARV